MQNPSISDVSTDDASLAQRFFAQQRRFAEIETRLVSDSVTQRPAFTIEDITHVIYRVTTHKRERLAETGAASRLLSSNHFGSWVCSTLSAKSNRQLDPMHAHVLRFSDHLFGDLAELGELDAVACEMLPYWQPAWSLLLLNDPNALFQSNHPARRLFELFVRVARCLDEYSGRRKDLFVREARRLALQCVHHGREKNMEFNSSMEEFVKILGEYQRESQSIEQRLIAKEQGSSNIRSAPLIVNEKVRQLMEGKRLARWIFDFLQDIWCKYLTVVYLRDGVASTAWKEGTAAVETLLWSLEVNDPEKVRQAYSTRIDGAIQCLRHGVEAIYSAVGSAESFFTRLEEVHAAIMLNASPDLGEMVEIPRTAAAPHAQRGAGHGPAWSGRPPLVGEWYLWKDNARIVRCRLIEDNRGYGYLLFANFSGIQVTRLDYEAAQHALNGGILQRIDGATLFSRLLVAALDKWQRDLEQREQEMQVFLDARKDAERRALEQRQQALDLERRSRAEHKAELRARAEAAARVESRRQARERAVDEKMADVGKLQLGGMVELIDDANHRVTTSLGLILKRSGKMIFVDRFGKKVAELLPKELATKIVEGSAQILNLGVAFEQTLQAVIGTPEEAMERRIDRSTEGDEYGD